MHHLMLANQGEVIGVLAVAGGLVIAIITIIMGTIRSTVATKQREQSRREIAAYIAEGSMTPDDGERLMKANAPGEKRCGF